MEELNGWQVLKIVVAWFGRKITKIVHIIYECLKNLKIWVKNFVKILLKKVFDYLTLILFGTILFFPLILYIITNKIYNIITLDEFKELLDIICKSYYIIIMGIIVIFYMFRNSIRKKLEQLSEVGNGVAKFSPQFNINNENTGGKACNGANSTIEEKREQIYDKIKDDVSDINGKGRRNAPSPLSRYTVTDAAFSGRMGARVEMACL